MKFHRVFRFVLMSWLVTATLSAKNSVVEESVAVFRQVGAEGKGNVEAAEAWKKLTAVNADAIVPLLEAMDESGTLAKNWIRSALEVIFENTQKQSPGQLPISQLQDFLQDKSQSSAARELAFDLISSADAELADSLKPKFLNDPSPGLRRGAVALLISQADDLLNEGKKPDAIKVLNQALDSARDVNQIKAIAKQLRTKAEQEVDLPRQFGFLMYWHVIGAFDNTDRTGYSKVFEPEKEVNLTGTYQGKTREVKWQTHSTTDEYGMVDFNTPFGPLKEVTGYAYTEFSSDKAQQVELRLGCKNAWKIWVNGEYIFGRDEYHRGMRIDQYALPVNLNKGANTILVKASQCEQEKDWTKEWQFQLRVCDSAGTAILATDRKPTPQKQTPKRRGTKQQ